MNAPGKAGIPTYEVFALRYSTLATRMARENLLAHDVHDGPMPMDYFIWAIVGGDRAIVVDTGFNHTSAKLRGRTFSAEPADLLRTMGIDPAKVDDVILSHLHYDHAGNQSLFPKARFHVQDAEMAYCTGRCMCHAPLRFPFEPDDVVETIRNVFAGRVAFHDGTWSIAPGITVHRVGGHSRGLQIIRVPTARGWVVLAADAAHYWANIRGRIPFPAVVDIAEMMEGYRLVNELADGPDFVIPGHDPAVMQVFPSAFGCSEIVRLS